MPADSPATQDPWTIGRLLAWTTEHFTTQGLDEPRLAAEILLAHALRCQRIQLYTRFKDEPGADGLTRYRDMVRKAATHTPIAYLVGHKEFFSLDFEVTPDVLIPRPETETLVEQAIRHCDACRGPVRILDLGTGSGCIMVTLLARCPEAVGVGTDISPGALAVARRNAERHAVVDRVHFIEADALHLPDAAVPEGGFDLIVSNPPYIAEGEMATLAPNVRDHEPAIALTPGGDGFGFFRVIASDAPRLLRPDGVVLVEIGAGQSEGVLGIFAADGGLAHTGTFRGPSDPHDRVMQFAKT